MVGDVVGRGVVGEKDGWTETVGEEDAKTVGTGLWVGTDEAKSVGAGLWVGVAEGNGVVGA